MEYLLKVSLFVICLKLNKPQHRCGEKNKKTNKTIDWQLFFNRVKQ